jgi:hypothetical protein
MMLQSGANRAILTKILAGVPAYAASPDTVRADALDAALARVAREAGPVPPATRDEMVRANKAAIRLTIAYISSAPAAAPPEPRPEYVPRDQAQADSAARIAELFGERQRQYAPPPAAAPPAALTDAVVETPPDNIDALYQQKLSERDADLAFAPPPPPQTKDDTVVFAAGDPPATVGGKRVSWQTDAMEVLRAEVAALRAEVAALREMVTAMALARAAPAEE